MKVRRVLEYEIQKKIYMFSKNTILNLIRLPRSLKNS